MRVLFVCTGNLCRSPVAERLTRMRAHDSLGTVADAVQITSAGLEAADGEEMHPHSAAALVRLGGDPAGFRSRSFAASMATEADLVLTMTRLHRTAVLKQTPRGLRRTFTLLEAAGLLDGADLSGLDHVPLADRAQELALRLDAARAFRSSTSADDIEDPIGERAAAHRRTTDTIHAALQPLAAVLFAQRDGATMPFQAQALSAPA